MDSTTIQSILDIGETIAVEFKRCGNGIETDVYETVCSFLNRFGGDKPEFVEGDVFRIIVPLDDRYSYDAGTTQSTTQTTQTTQSTKISLEKEILDLLERNPKLSQSQMAEELKADVNNIKYYIRKLQGQGKVGREGTSRNGKWIIL